MQQIAAWLEKLGMSEYAERFAENDIDFSILPELTDQDLEKIGVASLGHRRKILRAIAAFASAPAAQPAPVVRPALSTSSSASKPTPAVGASPPISSPFAAAETAGERRYLTVMFCDLVGSTAISAQLDAEEWRDLVGGYLDAATAAVAELGGHVVKKLGDGLLALFGYPVAHENDAERAARAALSIQRALAELNRKNAGTSRPKLAARIGLDIGPAVLDASGEIYGDVANIAARVQALAEPGAVLVTARVQRQVAGLFVAEERGTHALKGVPEPMALYRLIRASGGGRRAGQRQLTPLVGRDDEIAMLMRRWERAGAGDGQFVLIVGEPGLGKSRLIEEFHARLADRPHTWVEWSCSQLLQNTPLHPIAEWGRQRFGGADVPAERRLADLESSLQQVKLDPVENAPLLAPLVDIPLPPERVVQGVTPEEFRRRQLAALNNWMVAGARVQPVVLAFEDLHWADPTTIDVLKGIAERGALAPLFVLATTRPEFKPPWGSRSHQGTISLVPLDRHQVRHMVGEIAARHALPQDVIEGVTERTGGVPLFVEEVTRLLLERGEAGGIQAIPPTLQQSLMARLDRLGPAREVAQIGSVIGRGFSYSLLRAVAGIEETALQSALERLAEADILLVQGLPPESEYRFKHALIQDAAYENLLKSRRQALHRVVAEILRDEFPAIAAAEPEVLAHHFTHAGLDDAAIEWWGKAGDQALRRSAFKEATAHLGKAIEMADKIAQAAHATATQGSDRLRLQISYGNALISARGYGAQETTAAFARARELVAQAEDAADRFSAYYGLWVGPFTRGELAPMREVVQALLRDCENKPTSPEAGIAHRLAGTTNWYAGDFEEARVHLDQALAIFDPQRDRDLAYRFGHDVGVAEMAYLAMVRWSLGEIDRAHRLAAEMVTQAIQTGHIPTVVYGHMHKAIFELMRRNPSGAAPHVEVFVDLARQHVMPNWLAYGRFFEPWAHWHLAGRDGSLTDMRRAIATLREQGVALYTIALETLLAEVEAQEGQLETANTTVDRALTETERTGHRWFEAETHRIRGEILLKRDLANTAPVEEAFLTAIAVAQKQKARSFELRAALALAKLYQSTGRVAEAHAVLAPALEGFAPAPEFPEIEEAQVLLAALAETDEVKNATASRRRRLHLQTAYANALIHARGHGALETSAAFDKAQALAAGDDDAAERFSAYYGRWVGSLNRGEPTTMQETATAFLRETEHSPRSPEAGVAQRIAGLTSLYFGNYPEARERIEKALDILDSERDRELAFRFGQDQLAAAMIYLALALWPLGEVERARQFANRAVTQAAKSGNLQTLVYVNYHLCFFETVRGDRQRALPVAQALLDLAREHAMPVWEALGRFLHAWANWVVDDQQIELAEMRQGIERLRELGQGFHRSYLRGLLAEALADEGNLDIALAELDDALIEAGTMDQYWSDAELHRIRGEILWKRDPADTTPAEEAFLTAVAIAQQQKAKSFELRAALSLAKLYQSTNRAADAHAVLAPALEGFSPTPEFPEISEAQALLATLAETDEVKNAAASLQRRLKLQTSYGQAVMLSRGYASEEAKTAFTRARGLAAQIEDVAERFNAQYGLWVGSFMRGDFGLAREAAETCVREAETKGRMTEATVGRRILGLTCLWQGDFAEAQTNLARALEMYDPERDRDAKFRFYIDSCIGLKPYIAQTNWILGEFEQARSVMEGAVADAAASGHVPTQANAYFFKIIFDMVRGDAEAARTDAEIVIQISEQHGLALYLALGKLSAMWAGAQLDDRQADLTELLQSVSSFLEQGNKLYLPFYQGLFAELEAKRGDVQAALTRVENALALASETGEHFSDALLHRIRGEILLKRDVANTTPAEEAFLKAIAIAQQQKARSFELQAALALAKLYQSTGRAADARAVLSPPLEGFSPTPEFPDIAEAQTLLAALA